MYRVIASKEILILGYIWYHTKAKRLRISRDLRKLSEVARTEYSFRHHLKPALLWHLSVPFANPYEHF